MGNSSKLLIGALLLTACQTETGVGKCVGAFDQRKMDPRFEYEVSTRNVVLAVVFIEMIVPPVLVVAKYTHCPVAVKAYTGVTP